MRSVLRWEPIGQGIPGPFVETQALAWTILSVAKEGPPSPPLIYSQADEVDVDIGFLGVDISGEKRVPLLCTFRGSNTIPLSVKT